jgi:hypothetical protein
MFHKDWFSYSKVNMGDTQTHRQHGDRISLLLLIQSKESSLKVAEGWARLCHVKNEDVRKELKI